ncbi:hypothetical protein RYA07_00455, partial [Pseudomonas syringae pv. actinidiae]|nr:hypothetical protein [Pseudomonas syringae pv. actinidiae]
VSLQLSSLSLATAFKWLVSAHAGHTGSELAREGVITEPPLSTIVRRSALHAVLDALRPIFNVHGADL